MDFRVSKTKAHYPDGDSEPERVRGSHLRSQGQTEAWGSSRSLLTPS